MTRNYSMALVLLLAVAGCSPRTQQQILTVKGSDTMVQLGQRWAEVYMNQNPGIVIQVTGGGSGTGIAALINRTTDIALSSRTMSAEEREAAQAQRGQEVREIPVALDALAVFLNVSNPVESLLIDEISRIFRAEITNWRDLGGPDRPIVLYGRESSSGTYVYFKEHVLRNADFAPVYQGLPGTAAVVNAVANDAGGVGYGGIGYAAGIKTVPIQADAGAAAVVPSEENVLTNVYPLSRNLYFYVAGEPQGLAAEFINWVLSPPGQAVVSEADYYPLRAETMP